MAFLQSSKAKSYFLNSFKTKARLTYASGKLIFIWIAYYNN